MPSYCDIQYKKGRTEERLYGNLKTIFPNNIFTQYTIIFDDFLVDMPYMPDIVYYNKESRICIDIEVDEKFTEKESKMIHFSSDEKDNDRNEFFLDNGWLVIRFTESQIINDTMGCIVVIYNTIKKFDPKFVIDKQVYTNILERKSPVEKEKRWDVED